MREKELRGMGHEGRTSQVKSNPSERCVREAAPVKPPGCRYYIIFYSWFNGANEPMGPHLAPS